MPKATQIRSIAPRAQRNPPSTNLRVSKPESAPGAAETLETSGAADETIAAAAATGELAPLAAVDVGEDRATRVPPVVIKKPSLS